MGLSLRSPHRGRPLVPIQPQRHRSVSEQGCTPASESLLQGSDLRNEHKASLPDRGLGTATRDR